MQIRSWPLWIAIIAVVSGPWFGVVGHPQWGRVTWVPFHGFEDRPRDMLVNFLLFVPFGWSFVKARPGWSGILATVATAAAVSFAVEVPQLFYRLRDPSATDLVMAICGAAAGSFAAQTVYGGDARGAPGGREAGNRRGEQ